MSLGVLDRWVEADSAREYELGQRGDLLQCDTLWVYVLSGKESVYNVHFDVYLQD